MVAIVTGASSGVGAATAAALAQYGEHVVYAVRHTDKGRLVAASVRTPTRAGSTEVRRLDLANLLFSAELQRRLTAAGSPVLAMAAHPGFVATAMTGDLSNARLAVRLLAHSPQDGALPVLHAATADLPGDSFTGPQHVMHMRGGAQLINRSRKARDPQFAAQLWARSEQLTATAFPADAVARATGSEGSGPSPRRSGCC